MPNKLQMLAGLLSDGPQRNALLNMVRPQPTQVRGLLDTVPQLEPRRLGEALAATPIPVVSDVAAGLLAADDVRKGDYKSAALNGLGLLPFVPAAAGIFAGKGAKTADLVKQGMAEKMLAAGEDPAKVWQETGWGKGPDGKWRFEIDDSVSPTRMQVTEDALFGYPKVGQFMEHKPLYKAYPEAKEIPLGNIMGSGKGAFLPDQGVIELRAPTRGNQTMETNRAAHSTTLHELQHYIQGKEGFAMGGNPEMAFRDPRMYGSGAEGSDIARQMLSNKLREMAAPLSAEQYAKQAWQSDVVTPEILADYQKSYLPSVKNISPAIEMAAQRQVADEWYRRLGGEAESRLTQARQSLTPEQRSMQYPWEPAYFEKSTGVPVNQLIMRGLLGD